MMKFQTPSLKESAVCVSALLLWLAVTAAFIGFRPEHPSMAVLIAALFFSVKAFALGPGGVHAVELTYVKYTPYLILMILITLLQLLAVFSFNARVFQMRTAVLSAILMIALQAWLGVDYFTADKEWIFKFTAIFPLLSAILNFIAARYILRDQLLVESVTRLRSRKKNHKI